MSLPEDVKIELEIYKPNLKFKLGDQVFLKTDKKRKYPMLIDGFDTDQDSCSDYYTKWLNSQGSIEEDLFPEECLIT